VLLADALRAGPVVLDGGLATQLEAAGHDLGDELWSARLLAENPDAIVAAHRAFIDAGAQVITTASYQATLEGFARRGHDGEALLRRSVALARRAAQDRPVWTAASVGPYGAALADGSEYRGDYGLTVAELVRFHRPRLEILAAAEPDVLALETIPDVREAEALLIALEGIGVPAWLSYTVSSSAVSSPTVSSSTVSSSTVDGVRTRAGQSLAEAGAIARDQPGIIAVGVNCSAPDEAVAALGVLAAASGKPGVLYPNSGETWDAVARRWRGRSQPVDWATAAPLVGGCCRVMPADIADIADRVSRIGPRMRNDVN
jgi:homocysteine S-methyltransferase